MNSKRINLASIVTTMTIALFTLISAQAIAQAQGSSESNDSELNQRLARVRAATAKYHNVEAAIEDGFIQFGGCVETPGEGTAGIHYVNMQRFLQPGVILEEPETLLYIPTGDGNLRLVAVEYVNRALYIDTTGTLPGVFPSRRNPLPPNFQEVAGPFFLFDRMSEGPFLVPGTPWLYGLHAWVWAPNPNGMFADRNPRLSCG